MVSLFKFFGFCLYKAPMMRILIISFISFINVFSFKNLWLREKTVPSSLSITGIRN